MVSIEKRLLRAWKKKRGMRLSAEEVELLMLRGLQYLSEEQPSEANATESQVLTSGENAVAASTLRDTSDTDC
jgi:hypothetical protein